MFIKSKRLHFGRLTMNNKPTIEDVAKEAGVSIATVSRVINKQGGVKEKTEDKIINAIKKTGYIQNAVARSMKVKKTNTIGIIIPDIENPFFPAVISAIENKAREKNLYTILSSTNESALTEGKIIGNFLERGVDGVIITTADKNNPNLELLLKQKIPTVAIDREINLPSVDNVLIDNVQGSYEAMAHILKNGHQKVGIICGPQNTTPGYERFLGYQKAMKEFGLELDEKLIYYGDFKDSSGSKAVKHFFELTERPTAIFSCNNLMTIGAIKELRALNWSLGSEVSFVGFDDIEIATFIQPSLTVVKRQMYELGEIAFDLLHEKIYSNRLDSKKVMLTPSLEIRQSVNKI